MCTSWHTDSASALPYQSIRHRDFPMKIGENYFENRVFICTFAP